MNKSDLIQALAKEKNLDTEEASRIVHILVESMKDALREGRRIEIRGFGSFQLKEYAGYFGRNPQTGEKIWVKAKRLPYFRAGKGLGEYLNK